MTNCALEFSKHWIIVQQDATVFSLLYFCSQLYMFWVLTLETCRADYRSIINWIQLHLVGQLFSLIHDARTHEYKILKTFSGPCVGFHSLATYILFPFSLKCYKILYPYWVTNSGDMLARCLRNLSFFSRCHQYIHFISRQQFIWVWYTLLPYH